MLESERLLKLVILYRKEIEICEKALTEEYLRASKENEIWKQLIALEANQDPPDTDWSCIIQSDAIVESYQKRIELAKAQIKHLG